MKFYAGFYAYKIGTTEKLVTKMAAKKNHSFAPYISCPL